VKPPAALWGGRFTEGPDAALDRVNRSLPVDRRLWRQDIRGSQAWVAGLKGAGVLAAPEAEALLEGLESVVSQLAGWSEADWDTAPDEDIHTLVERLLGEEIGALAGKLHTGRSRNDQVATDTRLWAMEAVADLDGAIRELELALVEQAGYHISTPMPSFTHLQPAQPVSVAHWLASHAWPLERDRARLADASDRLSVLPLGSGAVAGCPFPIDREALARALGFRRVSENSMDAVADRDWVAELLFAASLLGTHVSRLAEDLVIFASPAFGFVRLSDAFSTGSSLMPQKRNPDALELARGKAGGLTGDLAGFLATLKGTPSGYNKDLQEDKTVLFRVVDTLDVLLPAVTGTVRTLDIDAGRCREGLDPALMATDLADALVELGVPFREAHEVVGRLLLAVEESGRSLEELSVADLRAAGAELVDVDLADLDLTAALDPVRSMQRRAAAGGTAPDRVKEQLAELRERL
jgi:argininosuccinate lyase